MTTTNNIYDFLENADKYTSHVRKYNTEEDMMSFACEQAKGAEDHVALFKYIDELHNYYCIGSSKLIVYMPEMHRCKRFRGKILIESHSSSQFYFEIQLSKKTDFTHPKRTDLGNDPTEGDSWHRIYRFHNIFLAREQAVPFVQLLLFCDLFRQRSLITIDPDVMGSITTQQLRAASGQAVSFRQCVLNEYT